MVYASLRTDLRHALWKYIMELGAVISIPWFLVRDVNQVLSEEDKTGGRFESWQSSGCLWEMLDVCQFTDLVGDCSRWRWPGLSTLDSRKSCRSVGREIQRISSHLQRISSNLLDGGAGMCMEVRKSINNGA